MSERQFDGPSYKEGQRRDWSAAATGWRRWWQTLERGLSPVGRRLIELAEITQGHKVLDVATGIGEPALTAAALVGPNGSVTATDIAPGMLEIARERAHEAGLRNIDFREMDAEALDLAGKGFDAALCRFGLMFLPDPELALKGIRAVLTDGGRRAAAVWGPPEAVPGPAATFGAIARELGLAPPAPGTPGLFSLAGPGVLSDAMVAAGFTDVRSETLAVSWAFESPERYVEYLQDVSAPIHNLLADEPQERRDAVWRAVGDVAGQFETADGSVVMTSEALLVTGRR